MKKKVQIQNLVYNYRMTHDTGFAPNPFWGVLTLATCKPQIRKYLKLGEAREVWLAGWYTEALKKTYRKENKKTFHAEEGHEYLIYLARVTKKISIGDYWTEFPEKRAIATHNLRCLKRYGDNIYEKIDDQVYKQHLNISHRSAKDKKTDLSGGNVLICNEFYYFGHQKPLRICAKKCPKIINRGYVKAVNVTEFLDYVKQHKPLYSRTRGPLLRVRKHD